jgi:hypothetical protein
MLKERMHHYAFCVSALALTVAALAILIKNPRFLKKIPRPQFQTEMVGLLSEFPSAFPCQEHGF